MSDSIRRHMFTRAEILIGAASVVIVLAIVGPYLLAVRESSRLAHCQANLEQLASAMHSYEAAFRHLPNAMGGTGGKDPLDGNLGRLSGLVYMLPYFAGMEPYDAIVQGNSEDGRSFPPYGPAPWVSDFTPWTVRPPELRCPGAPELEYAIPAKNYAFCIGDMGRNVHNSSSPRGMFAPGHCRKLEDVVDGLANTLALCEIGSKNGRRVPGQYAIEQPVDWLENPLSAVAISRNGEYDSDYPLSELGRGGNWVDGAAPFGLVNTILPPNCPTVVLGSEATSDGFYSAGSFHRGGVNCAMGDGSVRWISSSIDSGFLSKPVRLEDEAPDVSEGSKNENRFGLWGALGSAAGLENAIPIH